MRWTRGLPIAPRANDPSTLHKLDHVSNMAMNVAPSSASYGAIGRDKATNCGRKATKGRMLFGLSAVTE